MRSRLHRFYPWILVFCGCIGLLASFVLVNEKIAYLENPNEGLICDVNPLISCGSVISTDQASTFGFSNPILGVIGFSALIVIGINMLHGFSPKQSWYWQGLWAGTLFGVLFVHYLIFQSVYRIGALCPFCMVVWLVMIPIFWFTTVRLMRDGHLPIERYWAKANEFVQKNHLGILMGWYLVLTGLIVYRFI